MPRRGGLFNWRAKMLDDLMSIPHSRTGAVSRNAMFAAIIVVMILVGAAMAGWLNHGVEIFATMASSAWALCF